MTFYKTFFMLKKEGKKISPNINKRVILVPYKVYISIYKVYVKYILILNKVTY